MNLPKKDDIDIYGPFIFYGPEDKNKMPKFELRGDEVIGNSHLIIDSKELKKISDEYKKSLKQKQIQAYGGKRKTKKKSSKKKSRKKSKKKR